MVRSIQEFQSLAAAWGELEAAAMSPRPVFQSYDWIAAWIRVYGRLAGENPLVVFAGYRDQRLVFAWPMMRQRLGGLTLLRWISDPFSQYGDVLAAGGECPRTWMAASLDLIANVPGIDGIRLRHVRTDAAAYPFLGRTLSQRPLAGSGALARSLRLSVRAGV